MNIKKLDANPNFHFPNLTFSNNVIHSLAQVNWPLLNPTLLFLLLNSITYSLVCVQPLFISCRNVFIEEKSLLITKQ